MGRVRELVAGYASSPSTTPTAVTMAGGDSNSVRNYFAPATCYLDGIIREGATAGLVRIRSPRLHDNVKGIHFPVSETPTLGLLPPYLNQQLYPQDSLIIEATGGGAEYDVVGLSLYYSDLPGGQQRLHAWGDIVSLVRNVVTIEVATTSTATPTAWTDTVINTTDDLLKANTDYAILGYIVDTAVALVALKGPDTSNFRIGGPGKIFSELTSDYFVRLSNATGRPCIPVFNAANKFSTYVSTIDAGAGTTSNVTLVCAQLSTNLPS